MTDSWTSQIIGKTVDTIEQWEGCPCVITFSGGYRVQVESLWRLLSSGTLVLTSRDDGQFFGREQPVQALVELSNKLTGLSLSAVHFSADTADLTLNFGGHTFQVISDSSGYEAWQLEGPSGTVAVGQGGGNVAVFG